MNNIAATMCYTEQKTDKEVLNIVGGGRDALSAYTYANNMQTKGAHSRNRAKTRTNETERKTKNEVA